MTDFPQDLLERIKKALKKRGATEAQVKIEEDEIKVFAVIKEEIK